MSNIVAKFYGLGEDLEFKSISPSMEIKMDKISNLSCHFDMFTN